MSTKKSKDPLYARDGYRSYPDEFPIYPTHEEFPSSEYLYNSMHSPIGILARPFINNAINSMRKKDNELTKQLSEIARCNDCGAYINSYCDINTLRWFCTICNKKNNYTKAHIRYRHIDPKLVPELKNAVVDLDVPVRENGQVYSVPLAERPLIHLILIQENMQIDTIEATIDSIRKSLSSVHPDMFFALATFSTERIGIYSMKSDTPVVQFAQFLQYDSNEGVYIPVESLDHGGLNEVDSETGQPRIQLSSPLSDIIGFQDSCVKLRDCRDVLDQSLSSILNIQPENIHNNANGAALLSALQAIKNWIFSKTRTVSSLADPYPKATPINPDDSTGFANLFDFSRMLSVLNSYTDVKSSTKGARKTNVQSSSSSFEYTGIILHLFVDDVKMSLPSYLSYRTFADNLHLLSKQFIQLSVSINLYAVCAYDKDQSDVSSWKTLLSNTGGQIHRVTLGYYPANAVQYLSTLLDRIFHQIYATKCQMKLRTSAHLLYHYENDVSGCLLTKVSNEEDISVREGGGLSQSLDEFDVRAFPDALPIDVPGVYSIPAMSEDSCYAFQFQYIDNPLSSAMTEEYDAVYYQRQSRQPKRYLFAQFAMSYETIVAIEGDAKKEGEDENKEEENEDYIDHLCKQLGLDLQELIATSEENRQLFDAIRPPPQKKFSADGNTSFSSKSMKKITNYLNTRRYRPYPSSSSLQVIKQLRIITYGIECIDDANRLSANMILPNQFSLMLKINQMKMILEEKQFIEQYYINQQKKNKNKAKKNENEAKKINHKEEDDHFFDRRGIHTSSNSSSSSFKSENAEEEKQINKIINKLLQQDHEVASASSSSPSFSNQSITLLNQLLSLIHGKLEQYSHDYQYKEYTNNYYQLFHEIFQDFNITGNITIYCLHHLMYLIYSYFVFIERLNEYSITKQLNDNRKLYLRRRKMMLRKKRGGDYYEEDDNDDDNDIVEDEKMIDSYHYADEFVCFWWQIQYYQSMMIYRSFMPNFIALEEIQKEIVATSDEKEDDTNKITQEVKVDDVLLIPSPPSIKAKNPLMSSGPLQIISIAEETPQPRNDPPLPPPLPNGVSAPPLPTHDLSEPRQDATISSSSIVPPKNMKRVDFSIKSQFLSLRRDNVLATGCNHFLLDAVTKFVFYQTLQSSMAYPTTHSVSNADSATDSKDELGNKPFIEKKAFFPFLIHRLYEYPILPKLVQSQAGTATAVEFMDYFLEDSVHADFSFEQFKIVLQHLISSQAK